MHDPRYTDKVPKEWLDEKGLRLIYNSLVKLMNEDIQSVIYDDSEVRVLIQDNKSAIDIINGDGEGSIKKIVTDAVIRIVSGSPESFDTLKEISDWIDTHTDSAATMNQNIAFNKEAISKLEQLIGKLPNNTDANTIVGFIIEQLNLKGIEISDIQRRLRTVENIQNIPISASKIDDIFKEVVELANN